jgi:hypothetical protein
MKGSLIILVLLALLVGTYLVYKNLSGHRSEPEDAGRIEAIDKARKAADQIQGMQDRIQKKAREAAQ